MRNSLPVSSWAIDRDELPDVMSSGAVRAQIQVEPFSRAWIEGLREQAFLDDRGSGLWRPIRRRIIVDA